MYIHAILNLMYDLLGVGTIEDGACYTYTTHDYRRYVGMKELANVLHFMSNDDSPVQVSESRHANPNFEYFSFNVDDGSTLITIVINYDDPDFEEWENNNLIDEIEDEIINLDDNNNTTEGYHSNMPCDTFGLCPGTDCPNFFKCQG